MSFASFATLMTTNGTASAGTRFNLKADGVYSRAATQEAFAADGTATSPIIIRGYKDVPGDGYLGRIGGNGPLDTTNFAAITYTGNGNCSMIVTTNVVTESINISGAGAISVVAMSPSGIAIGCRFSNSGGATVVAGSASTMINCDIISTSTITTQPLVSMNGTLDSCLVQGSPSATGSQGVTVGASANILFNTFYGCGVGISIGGSYSGYIRGNTIIGCTGDGIFNANTSYLGRIVGNMITDNAGDGIDMAATTYGVLLAFNRLRDNATSVNFKGDWANATSYGQALLDTGTTGDTSTDYVNYAVQDFNLVRTSPATSASVPKFMSVGALQRALTAGGGPAQTSSASIK